MAAAHAGPYTCVHERPTSSAPACPAPGVFTCMLQSLAGAGGRVAAGRAAAAAAAP
eukprot:CAMPEP_0202878616 /NCGR_PEP_ID=MMETSP1391-20130828/32476_1 /ASSEMBLY_ACC=CAM_ASM_000867 /TAXON_ID=1034604 /ORGANISM="Chlamydomonas leiostraca, Strain SAG 11-49" /LENGTH=55 /DNA_ID=CAMNT_0049560835 /DNA_START=87 /DNA_END=250 /DNA_ORIENTATION=-